MIFKREMTRMDIPSGIQLCRHAGWNQVARDWDIFIQRNPNGCRAAIDEEIKMIIGTFATVVYEDRFAWVGMVLVHPLFRRQGIGTQLFDEALSLIADKVTVKLDATPAGREVYRKFNFQDEYEIVRMHRAPSVAQIPKTTFARAMKQEDFPYVAKLDHLVFGADRRFILERNFSEGPEYACVLEKDGEISGYCMGRPGHIADQLGPVVANTKEDAMQLLSFMLIKMGNKPLIVDAMKHTPEWISDLLSLGFVESRSLIRMFRGSNSYPGIPTKQFCILGPEFG
jgi:ribosomal protein S18 acetylase RimI-like enzyme